MITEDDVRRLGELKVWATERRAAHEASLKLIDEHGLLKSLQKLLQFGGRDVLKEMIEPLDAVDWLIAYIERETGIDASEPEATIEVMKAFRRRKQAK